MERARIAPFCPWLSNSECSLGILFSACPFWGLCGGDLYPCRVSADVVLVSEGRFGGVYMLFRRMVCNLSPAVGGVPWVGGRPRDAAGEG